MTEPLKLVDLMPAVAEKVAADEKHRQSCTDDRCERCHPEAAKARAAARKDAFREMTVRETLQCIPPAYAAAELTADWLMELVTPQNITRANEVVGAPRVAFIGPPGSGKTSLAAAMFRAVVRGGAKNIHRFHWTTSHKLAKARAIQPLGEGEAPLVQTCMDAPLLVLDELGAEDPRYASAVSEVLFERHDRALPTWVTTGVGPKEIATRYGGGIARRVFEDAVVFRLKGKP